MVLHRKRWQELLEQLTEELERQSSRLEQLERETREVEPGNASGSLGITAGSSSFSQDAKDEQFMWFLAIFSHFQPFSMA